MIKEFDIQGYVKNLPLEMTEEDFWHTVIGFIEKNGWSFGGGLEIKKISGCVSDTSPDMTIEEFEKTFLGFVERNGWSFEGSITICGQAGTATGMAKQHLFGSIVEIDEVSTHRWYADAEEWGCDCGDCRNFLTLARKRQLPAFVLEHLDKLGIPPEKATYVCQMYPDGDGQHYQFSYRIAGNILSGEATGEAGRCCHELYPYGAPGFPEPHFDLEFWVTLPWALDEPRASIKDEEFEYSFSDMLDDLRTGREIEFEYNGKLYGIFNGEGKWFFFADNQDEMLCQFEETDTLLEKVKSLSVQGKTLADIFDKKLYIQSSLCIF